MNEEKINKVLHTMDKILLSIAVFLFGFTIAIMVVFCAKDSIPDTLVTCVFGACTGECGAMAMIQGIKTLVRFKYGRNNNGFNENSSDDSDDDYSKVSSSLPETDDFR